MRRIITKELALRIVQKLGGQREASGTAHDNYGIYKDGILLATLSIRRGSEWDKGHDHIPRDMHVGPNFAKEFALCNRTVAHWHQKLRETGLLPGSPGEADD